MRTHDGPFKGYKVKKTVYICAAEYRRLREIATERDQLFKFNLWLRDKFIVFTKERSQYEEVVTTTQIVEGL